MVAAISTEGAVTSAEDSTAAPDTPASSDVSAPSAGNGVARRGSTSGRMSRVKELRESKDTEKEGARSVPVAPPSRQATVLVARPVEVSPSSSARGMRSVSGSSSTHGPERKSVSGTLRGSQGRIVPSGAMGTTSSGTGTRSPGRGPGAAPGPLSNRSPTRSRGNSPQTGRGVTSPSGRVGRRKEQELLEQKAVLESQITEATRSQMLLQRMLDEERTRGAADRAKLAALGSRIEQLEPSRQSGPKLFEENQTLYTELEAQSQQIEILRQQVQLLRGNDKEAIDSEPLREENLRLRRDLELSRAMLSRYTEELASIMPGMQKVLQKFNHDLKPPRSLTSKTQEEDQDQQDQHETGTLSTRVVAAMVSPDTAAPMAHQPSSSRLPVAPVAQDAPASFLAARKHEAARKASTSPQRSKERTQAPPRTSSPSGLAGGKYHSVTLGSRVMVTPTLAGRLCNRLADEAAHRRQKGTTAPEAPPRPRRRSTSPQATTAREDKPRWQF